MNRLQKKCLVGAACFHLLLALILLVGPGFLSSREKMQDMTVLDFVPVKTVDALMSGGGNPKGSLPPPPAPVMPVAPAPPVPGPAVMEKAPPEPDPKPVEVKASVPEPDSLELSPKPKRKLQITTTPVKRSAVSNQVSSDTRARDQAREQAREMADARRATAAAFGQAVAGIQGGLSGSTSIELKGPGGGGLPYANWLQAVKSVYDRAWVLPEGVTDDSATTTASITIARDGRVISATVKRFSGNSTVDHSVQMTLERVRYAAPLPDDAKEDQRTVTINFNAKTKLLG
ncbi:MAG TPA: TonB family protein [Verrucomicrobiae bacterium]|nr:TonB family protein [Verrucomicrobiae bacterium]